jgi:hypothetical protein
MKLIFILAFFIFSLSLLSACKNSGSEPVVKSESQPPPLPKEQPPIPENKPNNEPNKEKQLEANFALDKIRNASKGKEEKIIEAIEAVYPKAKELYQMTTTYGLVVRNHTKQVLEQFFSQKDFYDLSDSPMVREKITFFKILLAVHDIGKAEGPSKGRDPLEEHAYTIPHVKNIFKLLNFADEEIEIAVNLVDNDVLGDLARDITSLDEAKSKIKALAKKSGISPSLFFELQKLYWTSDATSYDTIRDLAFRVVDKGRLEHINIKIKELEESFKIITLGYGEYIILKGKDLKEKKPLECHSEEYKKAQNILFKYSPENIVYTKKTSFDVKNTIESRLDLIEKAFKEEELLKKLNLSLAFIPKTLYELIFIHQIIDQEISLSL